MIDKSRVADGLLFATGGERCRYLGKSRRERADWLKQNEGRYRRIEDVLRDDAPRVPSVEAEINLGAGPAEPADSSSFAEVRNDGDDKDDVPLADGSARRLLTSVRADIATDASERKRREAKAVGGDLEIHPKAFA